MSWTQRLRRSGRRIVLAAGLASPALSQSLAARSIGFIVPFGPGSTSDILARLVAGPAAARLGQPLIIENRPGAGGLIGAELLARAAPDGLTIGLGTITSHAVAPAMAAAPSFDVSRDFTPLCLLATSPTIAVTHPTIPADDLHGWLAHARRQGGSSFTSAGPGSITHLAGETLRARHGAPLLHVPYSQFGAALADVLAGRVDGLFYQLPALAPHVAAGALRPLAVMGRARLPDYPALPTAAETLGDQALDFATWFGVFMPAGVAPAAVARLQGALLGALDDRVVQASLPARGFASTGLDAAAFAPFFQAEIIRWRDIVEATGVRA